MNIKTLIAGIFAAALIIAPTYSFARHGADDGVGHEANEHAGGHEAHEHADGHEANEHAGGHEANDENDHAANGDNHRQRQNRRGRDKEVVTPPAPL